MERHDIVLHDIKVPSYALAGGHFRPFISDRSLIKMSTRAREHRDSGTGGHLGPPHMT